MLQASIAHEAASTAGTIAELLVISAPERRNTRFDEQEQTPLY
jgi:hypothetical protein